MCCVDVVCGNDNICDKMINEYQKTFKKKNYVFFLETKNKIKWVL